MGEHLRRYRVAHGLTQEEFAARLGTVESTINGWERGRIQPSVHHYPKIIQLLGYNPLPCPEDLGGKIRWARMTLGLSRPKAAKRFGFHEVSLLRWELWAQLPNSQTLRRVFEMLRQAEEGGD